MSCTASIRGSASLRDERKDARNITIVVANSLFAVPGNQEFVFVETGWHPGDHTQPGSDKKKNTAKFIAGNVVEERWNMLTSRTKFWFSVLKSYSCRTVSL